MSTIFWNVTSSGNWNDAADWNTGTVPGAGDDATLGVIGFAIAPNYTVTVTSAIDVDSITFTDANAVLSVPAGVIVTVAGAVEVMPGTAKVFGGTLDVAGDFVTSSGGNFDADQGGTVAVGGTLHNGGTTAIGDANLSVATTVSAAALDQIGTLNITGDSANGASGEATLDITGAAPAALTGTINLTGEALLEFGSGSFTSITSGSFLNLNDDTISSAAFSGLTSIAGTILNGSAALSLDNGSLLTIAGDLANTGQIDVDTNTVDGGSTLNITGTLANSGYLLIGTGNPGETGAGHLNAPATVNVGDIDNTGTVWIGGNNTGDTGGATEQATLDIGAAAPTSFTGNIFLVGDALLEYAGGSIQSIASGAELSIDGAQSVVADEGATSTSSALTGLTSVTGQAFGNPTALNIADGAVVSLAGPLDNSATIRIDTGTRQGGSTVTIANTLTNSGLFQIGAGLLSAATTVTAGDLANTGEVDVAGTAQFDPFGNPIAPADWFLATLDILAPAPAALTGTLNVSGDAVVEYASGSIQSIASGAELILSGTQAFVADNGATTTNSALTGLSSIAGTAFSNATALSMADGAVLSIAGPLDNSADVRIDLTVRQGGSMVTVAQTLTNSGLIQIGNTLLDAATAVTVGALANTGEIDVAGNGSGGNEQASLIVQAAAPTTLTGTLNLSGDALVQYASGSIQGIGSGAELILNGPQAFVADNGATTTNSALTGLSSIAGTAFSNATALSMADGAVLSIAGPLDNSADVRIDITVRQGGSMVTVAQTLTNSGLIQIGNTLLDAATAVTVGDLANTGEIDVAGNGSGGNEQASLIVQAAAPTTLTGTLNLSGDALVQYASGSIQGIGSGAELILSGPQAFVADNGATTTNSALTGLTSIAGTAFSNATALSMADGAVLSIAGPLDNSADVRIDLTVRQGGSMVTVAQTLTNSGLIQIGNTLLDAATAVTVGALANTGEIDVAGNGSGGNEQASLIVQAAAPTTLTGTLNLSGDALVQYASGSIQGIGSGAELILNGPQAFVADNGATTTNSALTGLSSIAGTAFGNATALSMADGAVLSIAGPLDNSANIRIDITVRQGGSMVTVAQTLTNSGLIQIGNTLLDAATAVTVGGLDNTGEIDVAGDGPDVASLNDLGAGANGGTLTIGADAGMGVAGSFTDTGTINLAGTLDIASPLTVTGSGSISMQGGLIVDPSNGALVIGTGNTLSGTGTIDVPLTNNGTITASGGVLDITGAVTGSGTFDIATGSELEIASPVSGGSFSFGGHVGTLKIDNPAGFADSITGLVAGDTIDLAGIQATGAVLNGSTLTVTAGTQVLNFNVSGTGLNGSNGFNIQSDQHGGTDLTLGTPGPTIIGPTSQEAFLGWPTVLGPLTIADPNAGNGTLTVTVTCQSGTLSGVDLDGNPLPGSGGTQLTLIGDLDDINTMLAGILYNGPSAGATDNVQVVVKDASNATAAQTIAVTTDTVPFTTVVMNALGEIYLISDTPTAVGGFNISDPYAQQTSQQIQFEAVAPITSLTAGGSGATVTGQGTDALNIVGTVPAINSYFADVIEGQSFILPLENEFWVCTTGPNLSVSYIVDLTTTAEQDVLAGQLLEQALGNLAKQLTAKYGSTVATQVVQSFAVGPLTTAEIVNYLELIGDIIAGLTHFTTSDGQLFELDAAGEFILLESTNAGDSFQVQVRLQPANGSSSISDITEIALAVGSDRVTFAVGRSSTVWIDGGAVSISPAGPIELAGGKISQIGPETYTVTWNTGETVTVFDNDSYLGLTANLVHNGSIIGLADSGFTLPDGTSLQQPLSNADLAEFANAWRVTQAGSLFDYGLGQSTSTFTNTNFPGDSITLADLPATVVAMASQAVAATGIADAGAIAAMEFDYIAAGGDPSILAVDASAYQGLSTSPVQISQSSPAPTVLGVFAPVSSVTQSQNGVTAVSFDVYLTEGETSSTEVDYQVVSPSSGDFNAAAFGGTLPSGDIVVPAGQTAGSVTIEVPAGALGSLPSEDVALQISTPSGVPIFAPSSVEAVSAPGATAPSGSGAAAAVPQLDYLGTLGTFSQSGNNYTLDLGDIVYGETIPTLQFGVANAASSPGDDLSGSFTWPTVAGFNPSVDGDSTSGASLVSSITPGSSDDNLDVNIVEDKFGAQSETIIYDPVDTNLSGYSSALSPITLTITDSLQVPGTMYSQAWGDVHIVTYSGSTYNFQAAGEFILAQSQTAGDSFDIQLRLQPYDSSASVTYITQVAASLGTDDLTFSAAQDQPATVRDNGQVMSLTMGGTVSLSGGTVTEISPTMFQVDWSTGETMTVTDMGFYFNVSDSAPDVPGSVVGLQTGDNLPSTTCDLYGTYANEWRVSPTTSLFYYAPGQSTQTFTDLDFPENDVTLANLPAGLIAQAQAAVAAAGITDPNLAQQAELDYLATGSIQTVNSGANANQQVTDTTAPAITICSPPAVAIGVMANAAKVTEASSGDTAVTFTAYLTGTESSPTAIDYAVVSPTAGYLGAAAIDGAASGSVTVAAGQSEAQFTLNVLPGALGTTPSDNLEVQVSDSAGLAVFAPTATSEIDNNQPEPGAPAQPVLGYLGNVGTFTFDSADNTYTLNLGGVVEGAGVLAAEFAVVNAAVGVADNVGGTFTPPTGQGFIVTGDNLPSPLAPGEVYEGLYTSINTFDLGTNTMSLTFDPTDVNDSGYSQSLAPIVLDITDDVTAAAVAQTNTPTTIIFPNAHVGATESQHVSITNTATSGAAGLDVTLTPSGNAIASGSITQLAPGKTDASHLTVGIDTSSAGALGGSVTENFVSDAGGGVTSPVAFQDPYIDVFGDVYRLADPTIQPGNLSVHVGASGSQTLTITNADPSDGYSENLIATVVGTTGAVHASGSTGEIAAGSAGTIGMTFSTTSAGAVGTVTLDLISDGGTGSSSIDGLGQTDLGDVTIPVAVTTNPIPAAAEIVDLSSGGTFTQQGSVYTLDLGPIWTAKTVSLGVLNSAMAPADPLGGSFTISGNTSSAFTNTGFAAFSGVAAGQSDGGLSVTLNTATTGTFSETITLDPVDSDGVTNPALAPETLIISGTVEPCGATGSLTGNTDTIVSGGTVANGTAVSLGITLEVLAGASATGVTVSNGGLEDIYGSAISTTVVEGGGDYVESGGFAAATDLQMCTDEFVEAGGSTSGTIVTDEAEQVVYVSGLAAATVISSGGVQIIAGSASGTIVSAGGEEYVGGPGTATATQIEVGGTEAVFGVDIDAAIGGIQYDFAIADGATVENGGLQYLESGTTESGAAVTSGGEQYIASGAVASGTLIAVGGAEVIEGTDNGGTVISGTQYDFGRASGGAVAAGGFQWVEPGSTAIGLTVQSGGQQYVGSSGTTLATDIAAQGVEVVIGTDSGALVSGTQYVFGTASGGTTFDGGSQQVEPGSTAAGMTVSSGGLQFVGLSGTTVDTTIEAFGAEETSGTDTGALISGTQYDFGTASDGTIYANALQLVQPGGIAVAMTVSSGGQQYIGSGGTALATDIAAQGAEVIFGVDSGALVSGTQYVFATASGGTTFDGGSQQVESGGTALGMTVSVGGQQDVGGGGTAIGTDIMSQGAEIVHGIDLNATISGTQYVLGLASGTVVGTGGYQQVSAGGTISAASISGGIIELMSGASTGDAPITFTGGGALILDASASFSGTVAGFGTASLNDTIDFADIPYLTSGAGATTLSWSQLTSSANPSGTLSLSGGGQTADITLLGQYAAGNFTLASDNHGGTYLTDPPITAATDPNPLVLTTTPHV